MATVRRPFDLPSSAAQHLVERFTLSSDCKHIDYEAIVEDSEYLAEPVIHRSRWDCRPDQKARGLPCDREVPGALRTRGLPETEDGPLGRLGLVAPGSARGHGSRR